MSGGEVNVRDPIVIVNKQDSFWFQICMDQPQIVYDYINVFVKWAMIIMPGQDLHATLPSSC